MVKAIIPSDHCAFERSHPYPLYEFQALLFTGANPGPVIGGLESRLQREGVKAKIHTADPFYADIIISVAPENLEAATAFMNRFNADRIGAKSL